MAKEQPRVKQAVDYLKTNKKPILVIIFILAIIAYISSQTTHYPQYSRSGTAYDRDGSYAVPSAGADNFLVREEAESLKSSQRYYQIKTGYAHIDSDNAEEDVRNTRTKISQLGGRIESESGYEAETTKTTTLTAKVPSKDFESFSTWLTEQFDVKDANFNYYTEDVGNVQNEIQILTDSLKVFEQMEKNVSQRAVNAETLQLLFDITQKKLEIMRLLRQYGYQIEQVQERANESTITVSFTEQKDDIDLIPENTKANFMAQLRQTFHQIVQIGIEIITMPLVVLAQAIKLVIYGIIIGAVLLLAYKIGKRIAPRL